MARLAARQRKPCGISVNPRRNYQIGFPDPQISIQ
jgi:hypothetical protein